MEQWSNGAKKVAQHLKVLVPVTALSLIVINLPKGSPKSDSNTNCFSLSNKVKRELSIPSDEDVILIRPHSCQSCGYGDAQAVSAIAKTKRSVICLLDADASIEDFNRWQVTDRVKVLKRDQVSAALRTPTVGIYLLNHASNQACRIEVNEI